MRLRRETGDWTIKFSRIVPSELAYQLKTEQLPTGLSAEDFVGAVVELIDYESNNVALVRKSMAPIVGMVNETPASDYAIHHIDFGFTADSNTGMHLYYNPENGKLGTDYDSIKDEDETSNDSGSGDGSGTAGK